MINYLFNYVNDFAFGLRGLLLNTYLYYKQMNIPADELSWSDNEKELIFFQVLTVLWEKIQKNTDSFSKRLIRCQVGE